MKRLLALLGFCLAISSSATSCKSDERLVHDISKAGPYGGELQLTRALAQAQLVATIHDRLESAGVCYFATSRTLEGVWRHAAAMPHHSHAADLAIESANFALAHQVLLAELAASSNYIVQDNKDLDHLKVSIVIDGEAAVHVNLFVYSRSEDGQRLVHPLLSYQPAIETVFPTKLASYFEGSIRVPADTRAFLLGQHGSELDAPSKAFSWTHMSYVVPHAGMTTEFPLVSVIIPTYERPQFLANAINLIQRQDYPNVEIIIVDDGRVSEMENSEMTAVLSASNVRYIYMTERISIGAKRNIAVAQATGEVVVHWDDDDYFREHRISAQVAPIIRGEVDMTVLEHHYYYILSTQSFYIIKRAASWGPHFGTFVYRKSLFDCGIRYPDNSMAEDYAFAEFALKKVMNNEDGKHVYVRHHNTWKFDFADFDVQVEKVDRPGFLSDRDWEHFSTVKSEPIVTQPPNYYASALLQWDRPELRPTWTDASYLDYPHYPLYPPIPSGLVVAEFNLTVPVVTISQSGGEATQQVIDLNLVSLEEIDDATALQDIDLQTVGWMMEQNNGSAPGGDITETIFTSHLGTVTSGANNATIQYLFNTFGSDELITTGSNYSFTVTPALLKFSLNVASWKWNSTSGKLRLTIKIDPPFVSFTRWDDTPQVGMTTFLFSSATADQASTVVRLLNFGEALGESPSRVSMEASAEVTSSSLSLTFDHFNDTLSFDPDIGLLLGSHGGSGQGESNDNLGLIIGVSVTIPLALAFVVLFISVVSVVAVLKRRAARARSRGAIAFDASLNSDDQL